MRKYTTKIHKLRSNTKLIKKNNTHIFIIFKPLKNITKVLKCIKKHITIFLEIFREKIEHAEVQLVRKQGANSKKIAKTKKEKPKPKPRDPDSQGALD